MMEQLDFMSKTRRECHPCVSPLSEAFETPLCPLHLQQETECFIVCVHDFLIEDNIERPLDLIFHG